MTHRWLPSLIGATALLPASALAAVDAARPVLLELFTSQGCSSCPPADRVLDGLSRRDDVLALSFHVDYWDSLGWADRFGSPAWIDRQRDYAGLRGFQIYTPQLVIDGQHDVVGSLRGDALAGIDRARREEHAASASIHRDGSKVSISVGAIPGAGEARGQILLVSFDDRRKTLIQRGENAGHELAYTNIVRSLRVVGDWRNTPMRLEVTLHEDERGERLALIIQSDDDAVWAVTSTASAPSAR